MLSIPSKVISANLGTATTAGETVTAKIDRIGYDYAVIAVGLEGTSATTAPAVCKLGDSSDNTTFTNITRFVGGGAGGFTLPTSIRTLGDALGKSIILFAADLRAQDRYIQLSVSVGATNVVTHTTMLFRPDEHIFTATAILPSPLRDVLVIG